MLRLLRVATVLLTINIYLPCQTNAKNADLKGEIISVPDLGFQYTAPQGMRDKTTPQNRQFRDHAASYAAKAPMTLLDMSSEDGDTSPEWHQIWIIIFPRAQFANPDDQAAENKINTALAGPHASPVGPPKSILVGGHKFLLSEFEQSEPPLLKAAKIYTTICKSQLVSFVFVSNSDGPMKLISESLKSLTFSGN